MFVFIISILPNYDLSNIKTKEVGDGQHGNARFATENEIIVSEYGEKNQRYIIIIKSGVLPTRTHLPLYWDYLPYPKPFTYMENKNIVSINRMSEDDLKFIGSGAEKLKVGMFG